MEVKPVSHFKKKKKEKQQNYWEQNQTASNFS